MERAMSDFNHIYDHLPEEEARHSPSIIRPDPRHERWFEPRSEPPRYDHRPDPRPEPLLEPKCEPRPEPSFVENVGSVTISRVGLVASEPPSSSSASSSLRNYLMAAPKRPPVLESMLMSKSENERTMEQRRQNMVEELARYAREEDFESAEQKQKMADDAERKLAESGSTTTYRKILPMPPLIKFNPSEELSPNQRLQQSLVSLLKAQPVATSGSFTSLEPSAPANQANFRPPQHLLKGMSVMSSSFKPLDFANSLLFHENQRSPRNRKPNYSDHEKRIFFTLLTPYIEFLEQRSQEHYMMTMKADAWKELTKKYNELVTEGGYVARGVEELKTFWKNVRRNSRRRSMADGQVPDLVERLPDGSLHGNLPNVKSENFAPPPPALLPKVSTEEQQALLTLNTLAAAAAAQQGAGGVRGFLGRHDDAGDTSSSYDQDLDVKNEPICHVSLGENSDEDPEASNSQSNSNDASSARFSLQPGLAGPYLLKKETHCTTILDQLLKDDTFTDVTLTAEGQNIRAHKMVLCLASSYFRQVLSKESNVKNVIVFRDIKFSELKNIINFIYTGEATVDATELESFMKTAEMLEISSLCEGQKHAVARGLAASQRKRQRPEEDAQNQPKKNKVTASPQSATSQSSPAKEDFVPLLLSSNMREDALSEEPAQESDSETELDKNNSPNTNETNVSNLLEELPLSNTSLSDPIKLEREETSETEPIPGRCPFCAIPAFSSPPDMFQHLLVHHTGQPTYPCENCLRVYLDNSHLQNHSQMCGTIPHLEHS